MIDATIRGESQLRDFFRRAPAQIRAGMIRILDRAGVRLAARMKTKLSGEVLNVRTGRLRRSITSSGRVTTDGYAVTVGTNVVYASVHEFGFTGNVVVPAHLRLVRKAWGRPVTNPTQHMVRAHTMRMRLPERSFARSSLAEQEAIINADIDRFLVQTLNNLAP